MYKERTIKMKKLRMFSLLLCICHLFICVTTASAVSLGPIVESSDVLLETKALQYIEKYIETTYLYVENDFVADTVLEIVDNRTSVMINNSENIPCLATRNGLVPITTLSENISFFKDTADYYKYIRSENGIKRYDFTMNLSIIDTYVNADYANVQLYSEVSFRYEPGGDIAVGGDYYTVEFAYANNTWVITNIIAEQLSAYGITVNTFNYAERIAAFELAQENKLETSSEDIIICPDNEETVAEVNMSVANNDYYNRSNAINYALTYTTSSHTGGGNNNAFLNTNFFNYSSLGGNCQNFASQCVWAGLYGSNQQNAINSFNRPMDRVGSLQWYGDKNGNKSPSWATCTYFFDYAKNSSLATAEEGLISAVYGDNGDLTVNDLSSIANATTRLPGSVAHVDGAQGNYTHAIVITAVDGTAANQVFFCANSPMRKGYTIEDDHADQKVKIVIPTAYRTVSECTNSQHVYGSSTTGTPCKCLNCGYIKLKVRGSIPNCYASGTTHAITATTSHRCYRIAVAVTTPSGTTTWQTFSNTSSISRNYTFSEKGLYTVRVDARDISDTETNSIVSSHYFTIRAY